jgi:hypothetical protein
MLPLLPTVGEIDHRVKPNNLSGKFTRQKFLGIVGAGAAYISLLNLPGCRVDQQSHHSPPGQPNDVRTFRSRPDLSPPYIEITTQAHDTASGFIFIAAKKGLGQDGPMIVDDLGRPVWFSKDRYATDFKVQRYKGRPVLTWWEGRVVAGHGVGEYLIFDDSYREITRVQAGNGQRGDLHEFLITPHDTALITAYEPVPIDLSAVGGPVGGGVWGGVLQEVDIETKEVLFEWHSLDHIGLEESYVEPPYDPAYLYDYFHINSIDVDHDNNLLLSARNTWTVYKVERKSGEILWRLGGKKSDFEMGPGAQSAFQHDARRQSDGTITIFDNGAHPKVHEQSRAVVLELDMDEMRATLLREYTFPEKLLATSQGNAQVLPNANVFVGWGSQPFISEFSQEGELLFDARFPPDGESYRAFRFPWSGHPRDDPAVALEQRPDDEVALYASWNGATEVATWEVIAGPRRDQLEALGAVPWGGFETPMLARTSEPYIAVRAKHRSGEVLGTSAPIKL